MCGFLNRQKEGGGQELSLSLAGAEASDYLNFVIKDESTGNWCAEELAAILQLHQLPPSRALLHIGFRDPCRLRHELRAALIA